jgi:choline/glycine/proline betaine transport protein
MKLNKPVFISATVLIFTLLCFSAFAPQTAEHLFVNTQKVLIRNGSWFYVLSVAIILLLAIYILFSRYGDIKLGPDHSSPDYSNLSWFAMLFSAGMGIGLMFFGVAEPVLHFIKPPIGEPQTVFAARQAMEITFFHWGLHAWAIYAMVGLILAYFSFRHGLPLTIRSALYPIFGKKIDSGFGHAVDVFAILGTVFGIATSLGYGVQQVNAGFNYLFGLPVSVGVQVGLIIIITFIATISVITGLDKGIKRLSELNLSLALLLMIFILVFGSTTYLLKALIQNIGSYLSVIVSKTFNLYAYQKNFWIGGWTLFYWAWWLSWSPFVGMFIARISRGRTIREFILGVILVPSLFTFLWMTVFGNSAINLILNQSQEKLALVVANSTSMAIFKFLEYFPYTGIVTLITVVMVIVFFVTSFDSGALVVDMLASGGCKETPVWQRTYWASIEGVIACVLLSIGGLEALQSATIATALPFAIILLMACFGLLKTLRIEGMKLQATQSAALLTNVACEREHSDSYKQRIDKILTIADESQVRAFIQTSVNSALNKLKEEFDANGAQVKLDSDKDSVFIKLFHGNEIDFIYGIRLCQYQPPSFTISSFESRKNKVYFRAEVFLTEGGQNYDVMGYSEEQIINDMLTNYERHMHFLSLIR